MDMKKKMSIALIVVALLTASQAVKAGPIGPVFSAAAEDASGPKEKGKEGAKEQKEKPPKQDKKYDDFRDKNGNGIDDRYEKKDPPKKKKKDDPGEMQGLEIRY